MYGDYEGFVNNLKPSHGCTAFIPAAAFGVR